MNLDNDIQLEENQPEDDHQVSDTVSLPPVIDNHENTDSSSEPPVPTQKDTNLHKITVSEKIDKVAAETESNENSKKNNKTRKQNASNKKSNSESNETLLAQKYYISSLENKVNHLENLVNVLQKTLDTNSNNTDNDNPRNKSTYAGTDPCNHSEGVKINLLENRVQMLENQNMFMNTMLMQNHTQAAIRDSQLLMNSQHYQSNVMAGTTLPGYSHPVYHRFQYAQQQPPLTPTYQQLFQAPSMYRPVYPQIPVMQVPGVYQGPVHTVPGFPGVYQGPVHTVPGFAAGPSGSTVQHHSHHATQPMVIPQPVQREAVPQQAQVEHQQPAQGVVRNRVVTQPVSQVIRPSTSDQKQQQEQTRAGNNNQGRKWSGGNKQRHRQVVEKDNGYKQPESSNNAQVQGQVENKEKENRIDKESPESSKKETGTGHFLYIPSLKVPPDVEDLELVISSEMTRL